MWKFASGTDRPTGVDVRLTVGDHRHHLGRLQHLFGLLRGVQPVHRLPFRQWTLAMRDRVYPVTAPDIAADQAETRPARGVHRDHRVHQHAEGIALSDRAEAAAALCCGRELHLTTVLDRQDMPPGTGRAGQIGPARNQLCRRHLRAGEEPPGLQLTLAVAAQPAQAHRFTRRHPFEDLRPLLSRRTSPNVPSDNSIAAPVGRGRASTRAACASAGAAPGRSIASSACAP